MFLRTKRLGNLRIRHTLLAQVVGNVQERPASLIWILSRSPRIPTRFLEYSVMTQIFSLGQTHYENHPSLSRLRIMSNFTILSMIPLMKYGSASYKNTRPSL